MSPHRIEIALCVVESYLHDTLIAKVLAKSILFDGGLVGRTYDEPKVVFYLSTPKRKALYPTHTLLTQVVV